MTSPNPDRSSEREDGAQSEAAGPDGGGYAPKRSVAARDEAKLSLVALRDVAVVAVLLSIFAAAESWATVSRLGFATFLSVVDGLLVGAATNALVHEWGHFVGARLGGGHAPLKPLSKFLPLYDFDYANNDGRAFLWMSYGGNIAHAALVVLYLFAHPHRRPRGHGRTGGRRLRLRGLFEPRRDPGDPAGATRGPGARSPGRHSRRIS